MACKYFDRCGYVFKEKFCKSQDVCKDCSAYKKYKEKEVKNNPYWENICKIAEKQRKKGIEIYGQGLEENTWDIQKRLTYLEEELVDALMYLEWCKDYISKQGLLEK